MADLFISYKSEDKAKAELLSKKLEAKGWTVWWDRDLLGGVDFDLAISRELSDAKVVIVIWSQLSIHSRFVKDEARIALDREALIPVSFDNSKPPIGFGMVQVIYLNDRFFDTEKYDKLCDSIAAKISRPTAPRRPVKPKRKKVYSIIIGSVFAIGLAIFLFSLFHVKPDPLRSKAGMVNQLFLQGKYDSIISLMVEGGKLPRDTIVTAADGAHSQVGDFVKTLDTFITKDNFFTFYNVKNQMQRGIWVTQVIFDDDKNVFGLYVATPR